jgi:pyridoxal phosphate enzyme (YggS family)
MPGHSLFPPPSSLSDVDPVRLEIEARLAEVRRAMTDAASRAGRRPGEVRLIAVSKTHPPAVVRVALAAGQEDFGENYAQELRDKVTALEGARTNTGLPPRWHFIGPVQSNKVKYLVGDVALIHGVATTSALDEVERRAAARGLVQDCLVQVNVAGETVKQGLAPSELPRLLDAFAAKAHARCRGLMLIPPFSARAEDSRRHFAALRELAAREQARNRARDRVDLSELSMGMSGDFLTAIEEGATLVRVGTAIFGTRTPKA